MEGVEGGEEEREEMRVEGEEVRVLTIECFLFIDELIIWMSRLQICK